MNCEENCEGPVNCEECEENCEASWKREVKEGRVARWGTFGRVEDGWEVEGEEDWEGWESGKEDGGADDDDEEGRNGVSVAVEEDEGMEGVDETEGSKTTAGNPELKPELKPEPEPELATPPTPALRLCGIFRGVVVVVLVVVVVGVSVDVEPEKFRL